MVDKPRCYNEKKEHSGDYLIELRRYNLGWNEEEVIRWCKECGDVVIDKESDGRKFGSVVPMQFSKLVKNVLNE